MSDELLAQIRERPDDDALRLVYADSLLERDDPRGELIQLQCGGAQTDAQRARLRELVASFVAEWKLAGLDVTFIRGFPSMVAGTVESFVAGRHLLARDLVDEVHVFPAADMTAFAALPELKLIDKLVIRSAPPGFDDMNASHLVGAAFARLRWLEIRANGVNTLAARALGRAPWLAGVHTLVIRSNPLADAGIAALAEGDGLGALASLELDDCRIGARGMAALGRAITNVEILKVSNDRAFKDPAVAELVRCELPNLQSLDLSGCVLLTAGGRALAQARWPALRHLLLGNCFIQDEGVAALVQSQILLSLVKLDLSGNGIGDAGARSLAEYAFTSLEWLDLSTNRLGRDGIRDLARSTRMPKLTYLALSSILADEDVATLAQIRPLFANRPQLQLA